MPDAIRRKSITASKRQLLPYALIVALGALPLIVLAVFAYVMSARAVEQLVRAGNDTSATITAAMVEREARGWVESLVNEARLPEIGAALVAGNETEIRRHLEIFVNAYPRLDRAFVTDTDGLLWADYPPAPESLGLQFDDRDWYAGVSAAGAPYISEVYQRNAAPQPLVVAVASPVQTPGTGAIAGYIVAQIRLEDLSGLLETIEVGAGGIVLLLDHRGAAVAHPTVDVQTTVSREYADLLDTLVPNRGEAVVRVRYADPFSGELVLASAVPARVLDHTWTVVSQQPVAAAFASNRTLAWQLGGAGVLMAALMAALVFGLARENARRRRAEVTLAAINDNLEERVAERTRALRQKEDELLQAQKMEAIGRLAGGVAHDFNNLLTVILGSTELLLERFGPEAPEGAELQSCHEAAERAANLTRQLLAFSRKQVMQPRILDLNQVLDDTRGILDRVVGEHIDLVWKLKPGLHPIRFDPSQIEQVVMNLVVNARDAMPSGGKLTIDTDNVVLDESYVADRPEAQTGPHVMLAVSDTGTGMDTETRKRIFEPFYTTKQLGRGTGLGLSTVYGIVRQGGGNIWVYSEPGRGTTFKVYLPRAAAGAAAAKPATPAAPDVPGSGTVLVVEDEDGVRRLVARVLADAGYEVLEAADSATAERIYDAHGTPIALLITDVVLPDVGGPELAAALTRRQPGIAVLYMSGYTDDAIVHSGMLDDTVAFIEKPLRPRELLRRVRELCTEQTDSGVG